MLPLSAGADQLPGAGGLPVGPGAEGHGWLVVGPDEAPKIVHVPPRGSVEVGGGRTMSGNGGTVRLAARLNSMPEAIAAVGREAYLIFPPGAGARRLVLRASVAPAPVGNLWDLEQHERLDAMPSLDVPGTLTGFAATDLGLAAIVSEGQPGRPTLWVLRRERWTPVDLPSGLEGGVLHLVAMPSGIGVLAQSEEKTELWRGRAMGVKTGPQPAVEWSATPVPAIGLAGQAGPGNLFWIAGALVFAARSPEGLELREARPSGVHTLARLPEVDERFAMTALPQSGRVVLVWTRPKPGSAPAGEGGKDAPPPEQDYFVREVSVYTGRVLYEGGAADSWPFSMVEFRLLAVLLIAIAVGVLLFVLRPEIGDGAVLLPQGTALAEPWRRAVAGGMDLTVAWLVVSWSVGVSLEALMYPVLGAMLVPNILLILAVGCAHSTLGEWAFGRSIGKAITGCRVAVVGVTGDPGAGSAPPRSPSFRAALVRNLFRWGVPPLGIAALADPGGRHRGDLLARTAVVVTVEADNQGGA
jgi:hypothetical protein